MLKLENNFPDFWRKHFHLQSINHLNCAVFCKNIGSGSFGKIDIYKCMENHKKSCCCNTFFIVKCLKRETKKCYKAMLNEYTIGIMLNHINIRKVIDVDTLKHALIYEYIPNSVDLYDFITNSKYDSYKNSKNILKIIDNIKNGIKYIHSQKIAHLDLKLENIIISLNKKYEIDSIKLIDFGSAMVFELYDKIIMVSGVHGTLAYAAPEEFSNEPFYADKADIWAFGLIMYDTIFNSVPWKKATREDFNFNGYIENDSFLFYNKRYILSKELKMEILDALNINPENRKI